MILTDDGPPTHLIFAPVAAGAHRDASITKPEVISGLDTTTEISMPHIRGTVLVGEKRR